MNRERTNMIDNQISVSTHKHINRAIMFKFTLYFYYAHLTHMCDCNCRLARRYRLLLVIDFFILSSCCFSLMHRQLIQLFIQFIECFTWTVPLFICLYTVDLLVDIEKHADNSCNYWHSIALFLPLPLFLNANSRRSFA